MMMMPHKLTAVNTQVLCSIVPPLFHSMEHTQDIDFKGKNAHFTMIVPLFHNIYKARRIPKSLYNVQCQRGFGRASLG